MEFAPVLPPELYPWMDHNGYHMVQAHMIARNTRVKEWFKTAAGRGDVVILDNGVYETNEPQVDVLFDVAKEIRPTIIVCPDVLSSVGETIKMAWTYLKACRNKARAVMLVPQGKTIMEWGHCTSQLTDIARRMDVDEYYIGVPCVLDDVDRDNGRLKAIDLLVDWYGHDIVWKMHLLGVRQTLAAVKPIVEKYGHCLTGLDSSLPYAHALAGMKTEEDAYKTRLDESDWKVTYDEVTNDVYHLAVRNIWRMREMLAEWSNA